MASLQMLPFVLYFTKNPSKLVFHPKKRIFHIKNWNNALFSVIFAVLNAKEQCEMQDKR
jgi:galactose-1-phosphate uridylyltransferase